MTNPKPLTAEALIEVMARAYEHERSEQNISGNHDPKSASIAAMQSALVLYTRVTSGRGEGVSKCLLCGIKNADPRPWDARSSICPDCEDREAALLPPTAKDAEITRLTEWNRLQAEDIVTLGDEVGRLREALTPSEETKAAYMGEFRFQFSNFTPNVPWTTIKEIMAAIRARAALALQETGE